MLEKEIYRLADYYDNHPKKHLTIVSKNDFIKLRLNEILKIKLEALKHWTPKSKELYKQKYNRINKEVKKLKSYLEEN